MVLSVLRAVAVGLAAMASVSAHAQSRTLRVTLQPSIGNPLGQNLVEFANEVETRTDGALKIEIVDRARLYSDDQVPQAIASGGVELGSVSVGQYGKSVPAVNIFLQPFMFNFEALMRAALKPGGPLRAALEEELLKKGGARVLWWQTYGQNVLFSKTKPLTSPAAMSNQDVRVLDAASAEFVKLCGGKAHIMPAVKLQEALTKGTVSVAMTSINSVVERELWRHTDAITQTHHAPVLVLVVAGRTVWDSLSSDHRRILTEAAHKAEELYWTRFAQTETDAYAFAAQKGMKVHELSRDNIQSWRICSSPQLEAFARQSGVLGARLFAAYGRLRTEPCCSTQPGKRP